MPSLDHDALGTSPSTRHLIALLAGQTRARIRRRLDELDAAPSPENAARLFDLDPAPARESERGIGPGSTPAAARITRVLGWFDEAFPPLLREIPDPPLVLYLRGDWRALHLPQIAVVGARRCTRQGKQVARNFARSFAEAGVSVASGLALGIDGAAHQGALLGSGATVAVLGCGLAKTYPASHAALAEEIVAHHGVLVSEYPPDRPALPNQFPERNRLISGMAQGVVVIEASARSGSLITARLALEQGRDVFAVPGSVDSFVSAGCHRLIKQGASLVTEARDVLDELGLGRRAIADGPGADVDTVRRELDDAQRAVFDTLGGEAMTLDEVSLALSLRLTDAAVTQALVELELQGFVAKKPLGYIRVL